MIALINLPKLFGLCFYNVCDDYFYFRHTTKLFLNCAIILAGVR